MKSKSLDAILATVLLLAVISGFATTWEQTYTQGGYYSIAMSADGRIICAVPSGSHPMISTDSGKTWTVVGNSPQIGGISDGVAVSADGTKIYALNLYQSVFISTNQGLTWTTTSFPSDAAYQIACSADGTKVIAASQNGPIYYSTNNGDNCYTSSVPSAAWASVASSSDGQQMVAVVKGGDIYFSTNFGAIWKQAGLSSQSWRSACVSSDGKWIGAITGTGSYISSNAGVDWLTNDIDGWSIACSANGTNWIIARPQVYTSNDGGITWVTNLSSVYAIASAISADGCEMVDLELNGIWVGRAIPSPQLKIQSQDSNLALSWLIPSTNFVLQQNADLRSTNWIAVSNGPTLNFTNLQQEVSLPAATNNAFFRLMAQ